MGCNMILNFFVIEYIKKHSRNTSDLIIKKILSAVFKLFDIFPIDCFPVQETALCLVESTDWERLSALLAPDELAPLRPLILLVGCGHCSTLDNVQTMLQTICSPQVE